MAELILLRAGETVRSDSDHVLIARADGKFIVTGICRGETGRRMFRHSPFNSREDAFIVASQWADANDIPAIYLDEG